MYRCSSLAFRLVIQSGKFSEVVQPTICIVVESSKIQAASQESQNPSNLSISFGAVQAQLRTFIELNYEQQRTSLLRKHLKCTLTYFRYTSKQLTASTLHSELLFFSFRSASFILFSRLEFFIWQPDVFF